MRAPEFDLLIHGGLVVDGTGAPARRADVAVANGRVVEVAERVEGRARELLDAEGHIVTPGWIDIHTHFDGQVTWDDALEPSFGHGVTTIVTGNCGVGFAPVRPGEQNALIDIMEGVEDIPGVVLHEAMPWGAWESYPEYLAFLGSRRFALDVGSHMSHGALRAYVLGAEHAFRREADADEIARMASLVEAGMRAGSMGLSTNRAIGHRSLSGEPVPGTYASEEELTVLAKAMGATNAGVVQLMPGGGMGAIQGLGPDWTSLNDEIALLGRLSRASGRPFTYTMFQLADDPEGWRDVLARSVAENARGARLHPQVAPRQPALLMSLAGYHPLQRRETYLKIRHLPLAARVTEMRKPETKAAILADRDILDPNPGSMENFLCNLLRDNLGRLFPLGSPPDYEPDLARSVGGVAKSRNDSVQSVFYDLMLDFDGDNIFMLSETNYVHGNFDAVFEMFMHPATVTGLSDAGAHVKFICDASIPTHTLTYFVRDRTRGARMPLEAAVAKLTDRNAQLYGMADRGRITPGRRADINVIDLDHLSLDAPSMRYDLPQGAGRFLQAAHGYRATFVRGVKTREFDEDTGARPGRLVSNSLASSGR